MDCIIKSMLIASLTISIALFAGEAKQVSFNIDGMTCQGCAGKVSAILDTTVGVSSYNVSVQDKNCKITYDSALTNPEAIKAELTKTEFTISDVNKEKQNVSVFSWIKKILN